MASVVHTSSLNGNGALPPKEQQTVTFPAVNQKSVTRTNLIRLRRICVFVKCGTALFGILLTILYTELLLDKDIIMTISKWLPLKTFMSLSTLVLLGSIIYYHICRHKLNVLDHKKIILWRTILLVSVELLCCVWYPLPYELIGYIAGALNVKFQPVYIDLFLTIPMMLRLYLVPHLVYECTRFDKNPIIKIMTRMHKTKINVQFVFKYYIHRYPFTLIFSLLLVTVLVCSWMIRVCEQPYISKSWVYYDFGEIVYMTFITLLTIGYGDILPETSCSRTMAVITGLAGVGTIALLVAILVHLIGFSNSERVAVDSVSNPDRQKKYKTAAANAIKFYWLLTKLQQSELNKLKRKALRRKLRESVRTMQSLRSNEIDNGIDVTEIYNLLQQVLKNQREMKAKLRL